MILVQRNRWTGRVVDSFARCSSCLTTLSTAKSVTRQYNNNLSAPLRLFVRAMSECGHQHRSLRYLRVLPVEQCPGGALSLSSLPLLGVACGLTSSASLRSFRSRQQLNRIRVNAVENLRTTSPAPSVELWLLRHPYV